MEERIDVGSKKTDVREVAARSTQAQRIAEDIVSWILAFGAGGLAALFFFLDLWEVVAVMVIVCLVQITSRIYFICLGLQDDWDDRHAPWRNEHKRRRR